MNEEISQNASIELLRKLRNIQKAEAQGLSSDHEESIIIVEKVDPNLIKRWDGKDRPENEMGDLNELAGSLRDVGQQLPCIVRDTSDEGYKYELISGERRWRAAKIAKMKLHVRVLSLDDRMASLAQAVENKDRENLSDYAVGINYAKQIKDGLLKQKDLTDILKISKQQVSRLLSFNRIPTPIFDAIGDFREVSARTATELCRLSAKGKEYSDAIISIADDIRKGSLGNHRLSKKIESIINPKKRLNTLTEKIIGEDGQHLFTLRLDNNSNPSIHFPNDIVRLLNTKKLNIKELTDRFKEVIREELLKTF